MNLVNPMRYPTRLTIACALALSFAPERGIAQGRDWAFDFKIMDSRITRGETRTGVTVGHVVVSKGRIRMDMNGNSPSITMPGMVDGGRVSMIVEDNGKLITFLLPKTKEYIQFRPAEIVKRTQQMFESVGATVKLDFSGPEPKVENLGMGPVILGHQTVHYRVTTAMKINMSTMGESESVEMSSVSDQYLAPGLKEVMDPFYGLKSVGHSTTEMLGVGYKGYMEKMDAIKTKLPKVPELREESQISTTGTGGEETKVNTVREITRIQRVTASADLFAVPKGYKNLEMPMGMSRPTRK
jgi:hypothetical protein